MAFHRLLTACFLIAVALAGCGKEEKKTQGLPPATSWQTPAQAAAPGANPHGGADMGNPHAGMGMGMGNPHAGMDMNNPHAGMDMNNPHAGMDMNNPHAGMGMGNPHAGMDMNNPHAGMDMGGGVDVTQMGLQPPDPDRPIDPKKFIKGTLKPTAETRPAIPPGSVIFFSVKRVDPKTGEPTGAPLAVKRMVLASWPMWFYITEEDAMVQGTDLTGDVLITAWTDSDQDAMTKLPGDVLGKVRASIPAEEVTLVLNERVPGTGTQQAMP